MMYGNKLAVAIKSNGKVLREFKDTVYIPFASEYSILIKNLNTVRVLVNVFIDGDNVIPGGLVVNVGQEVDLERWVRNSNLNEGNKFKFIERTASVEHHRGIKLEDGIVRIEYQFEKVYQRQDGWLAKGTPISQSPEYNGILRGLQNGTLHVSGGLGGVSTQGVAAINSVNISATSAVFNDAGITVAGSKSEQKFSTVGSFATEPEKHSLVIKLLGETPDNKPVVVPVTVKSKPKCTTCGKQNKATAKFCSACGTSLEIFA